MTKLTATEARRRLDTLVDEVQDSHEPVRIAGKRGDAVLIGEHDWEAVQETRFRDPLQGPISRW